MLSWVATERIAAAQRNDASRPIRQDAEPLPDEGLLAKLASFGIELDRPSLERLCDQHLSAQEIVKPMLDTMKFETRREEVESDWVWICLTALWQRWFPDKPCFELLDDKIQAGLRSEPICRPGGWLPRMAGRLG